MNDSDEAAFLKAYDPEAFPRPSLAVDVALVTAHEARLKVLMLQREAQPFRGRWSLPGGFVALDESLDDAARRVLRDKGGLDGVYLEQLYTFGAPDRDPRTRVISVAYFALVDHARLVAAVESSSDRSAEPIAVASLDVPWPDEVPPAGAGPIALRRDDGEALPIAFDHADVLAVLVQRLRGKLDYAALGFQLLPDRFTLRQLQDVHEVVLARPLNKDSFRRRVLASGLVAATGERETDVVHRPAELYRFVRPSGV